jgi:hypothetical protein
LVNEPNSKIKENKERCKDRVEEKESRINIKGRIRDKE